MALSATYSLSLNISRDSDTTTSHGQSVPISNHLSVKKVFLLSKLNLWCSLRSRDTYRLPWLLSIFSEKYFQFRSADHQKDTKKEF